MGDHHCAAPVYLIARRRQSADALHAIADDCTIAGLGRRSLLPSIPETIMSTTPTEATAVRNVLVSTISPEVRSRVRFGTCLTADQAALQCACGMLMYGCIRMLLVRQNGTC